MEPHHHHIVLFVSRGFLISICDASRVYRFTQRPLRWRHFPYRMFNTPREYGNSDASLCCSSCVCACVRWLVFFCFQLFLIHLILCLFVKFFRELFFISQRFDFNYPPKLDIDPDFETIRNPTNGCEAALNCCRNSLFGPFAQLYKQEIRARVRIMTSNQFSL